MLAFLLLIVYMPSRQPFFHMTCGTWRANSHWLKILSFSHCLKIKKMHKYRIFFFLFYSFTVIFFFFPLGFSKMVKCDNLAWRPWAYLINQSDLAQEKYSDLKRLLVPWRSFQGVSDGESADFLFNDAHHHHQPPANWSSEALLHQWSHLHLTLQSPPLRV